MDHFRQEIEHSAAVEIELAKRDMDTAVQQIESDAAANIELAQAEMENMTWKQKEEAFRAADLQMAEERELWSKKEAQLQESLLQLQMIASQELKDQHGKLTSHYEAIIREKDDDAKAEEESMARTLREQAEDGGPRGRSVERGVRKAGRGGGRKDVAKPCHGERVLQRQGCRNVHAAGGAVLSTGAVGGEGSAPPR